MCECAAATAAAASVSWVVRENFSAEEEIDQRPRVSMETTTTCSTSGDYLFRS